MMKKFNLTVLFILGVVLTPGLLIAASEVVIAYANISARVSPLWIAQEKGFFAKYGVNVQQIYMPGSPVMIAEHGGRPSSDREQRWHGRARRRGRRVGLACHRHIHKPHPFRPGGQIQHQKSQRFTR